MDRDNFLLLSIRQPFSQLIILGKKKYELRKRPPRIKCRYVLIYETRPTKAVIGYFEVSRMLIDNPDKIWEMTKSKSFVSKEYFENYFKNKETGVAFEIKESKKLEMPIPLSDLGISHAPQDFMYLDSAEFKDLITL